MRKTISGLTIGLLVAGSLVAPAIAQQKDDHSKNVKMIGSTPLPGATDVEFTKTALPS